VKGRREQLAAELRQVGETLAQIKVVAGAYNHRQFALPPIAI
jgi:hypothetical protein